MLFRADYFLLGACFFRAGLAHEPHSHVVCICTARLCALSKASLLTEGSKIVV